MSKKSNINDNVDDIDNDVVEKTVIKNRLKKQKNLMDYINKNKCNYGDHDFTHTWLDNIRNFTFKIVDEDYEEFIENYINECKKNYGKLHIIEKPKEIGPLLFDFDFKQKTNNRSITKDMIVKIIQIINNSIRKYFVIKKSKKCFYDSYVLLKDKPFFNESKKNYSDGFHIHYPNLILDVVDRFLIFDESKKEISALNIFEDLYDELVETKKEIANETIFDSCVIKKNSWFMYGSGKKIGDKVNLYEVGYVFDFNVDEIEDIKNQNDIIILLAIRHNKIKDINYKSDLTEKLEEIKDKYMNKSTRFDIKKLFINNKNTNDRIINDDNEFNEEEVGTNLNNKINKFISKDFSKSNDDIELAKRLIKLLNKKRAGPFNNWIIVGWSLFNTSPTLLPEFIEFSKQDAKKYEEGCCEKVWEDCVRYSVENNLNNGYTIGSLYRWAKEDSPKGILTIIREKINNLLEEGDIKTDFDVACIIKEIYKYDYICTSIKNNSWWQFNNHKWALVDDAYTLSLKMSTEVSKEFATLASAYMLQSTNETGHRSDMLIKKSKDILKLIQDLKKKAPKERIISQCSLLFFNDKFEEKLDQNNYLVGFENGVYDLKNNIFRNGCPDDHISKSTGYDYNSKFSENDKMIKDIEKFFKTIQPEDDMRLFILCYCASFLEGGNKDQKFMIWTGSGSNSKGTLIELLDHTLGSYYGTLPPTLLTQKRKGSSSATPELADKFGTRLLTLQEPEEDDKINIGCMKELTGQDKIMARPLYRDPFYYVPQFKLLLACNKLPSIPSDDGGTWRRIRVIDFSQKFVDKPVLPNEQKKDPELRGKLKTWNNGLIWLLINKYYPIYREKGLDSLEPARVKLSTDKYKKDSNIYMEFLNDALEIDDKESLPKELVWGIFKEWHSNSYNGIKPPPQKRLVEFFENSNYKINRGIINGIKLKDNEINEGIDN